MTSLNGLKAFKVRSASTPIVALPIFHWDDLCGVGLGTDDSARALDYLKRSAR